jgi:hypothetical protein
MLWGLIPSCSPKHASQSKLILVRSSQSSGFCRPTMTPITRLSAQCAIVLGIAVRVLKAHDSYVSLSLLNEARSAFDVLWVDSESDHVELMSNDGGVLPGRYFSFEYVLR